MPPFVGSLLHAFGEYLYDLAAVKRLVAAFKDKGSICDALDHIFCCAEVGNVARKPGQRQQALDFLADGVLGTRLDELALMGGYRAEVAPSETSPVSVDRELDHIVGRDAFVLIPGMGQFGER